MCVCVWASVWIRFVGYVGVRVLCGESKGRGWVVGAVHLLCAGGGSHGAVRRVFVGLRCTVAEHFEILSQKYTYFSFFSLFCV